MKTKNLKLKISISIATSAMVLAFPFGVLASEINVKNVIKFVNESRVAQGFSELKENEKLNKIAQDKLEDMITNKYFAHTSPKGITPWFWFEKNGYDYKYAGENLAINFLKAEDQHKAWMASPTHRKNILNTSYQEIGVAVGAGEINGQTSIITVQEFGTLAGASDVPNNAQNFSGQGMKTPVEKGVELQPTVLSVKDLTSEEYLNKRFGDKVAVEKSILERMGEYVETHQTVMWEYAWMFSVILMFLSIVLSSLSFMAVATHHIIDVRNMENNFSANSQMARHVF
ncbi:MAG TPA: CAP domain-containing protein [Candidatus Moranbacteria bacterium]|nr:CAP domain-containing protein [Candidatus Moranbacteria bacterium]